MEVAAIVLAVVFTAAALYILVQQLRAAGRHESLRRRFIAGTSFSQRRRFAKVARAGKPVEGAEDAEKVKQLLEWHRAMHGTSQSPETLRRLIAAMILLPVVEILIQVASDKPLHEPAVLIKVLLPLMVLGMLTLILRGMNDKHEDTIRANGWTCDSDS